MKTLIKAFAILIATTASGIADEWTGPTTIDYDAIFVDSPVSGSYFIEFPVLIAFKQIKDSDNGGFIEHLQEELLTTLTHEFYGDAGSAGNIAVFGSTNGLGGEISGYAGEYYKFEVRPEQNALIKASERFQTLVAFDPPLNVWGTDEWLEYKEAASDLQKSINKYNQTLDNIDSFLQSIEDGY